MDIEAYRVYSRTFTGWEWLFYHFGPYPLEIDTVLKSLDLDIPQEEIISRTGTTAKLFSSSESINEEFEEQVTSSEKSIVDRVIDRWALDNLNDLLNHVYFYTEPMREAARGSILDFQAVKRTRINTGTKITVDHDVQRSLREKFIEVKNKRTAVSQLDPTPRFDTVFFSNIQNIYLDEYFSIQTGDVEINQEHKAEIKNQSE